MTGFTRQGARATAPACAGNHFRGDGGPATDALLAEHLGLAVDDSGNVYVADSDNHRVRRIDGATGTIETVAGSGRGGGGDGRHAQSASGVAVDDSGDVYVADKYNHRVRAG